MYKFAPHRQLSSQVASYWYYEVRDNPLKQRILPGICGTLIVQIGPEATIGKKNNSWERRDPCAFVEGHFDQHFLIRFQPGTKLYGVMFNPLGIRPFIRDTLTGLNNDFISLHDIFGKRGKELNESINELRDSRDVIRTFDRFLLGSYDSGGEATPHLRYAFDLITGSDGNIRVSEIVREVGVSERKLQRDFKEQTGSTLERFMKLVRFKKVMKMLERGELMTLKDLYFELNYYDRSHLMNDIKKYSGLTLSNLLSEETSISKFLSTS